MNVVSRDNGFLLDFNKTDNLIELEGNFTDLIVGSPYNSLWTIGTIYKKKSTQSGGLQTIEGLLMLKDIELAYTNTGYFKVDARHLYFTDEKLDGIKKQNSTEYTYGCTSTSLGTPSAMIGEISIETGVFLFPVLAKNEEVEIVISNDSYLPSIFSSLHWLGDLNIRGQ